MTRSGNPEPKIQIVANIDKLRELAKPMIGLGTLVCVNSEGCLIAGGPGAAVGVVVARRDYAVDVKLVTSLQREDGAMICDGALLTLGIGDDFR